MTKPRVNPLMSARSALILLLALMIAAIAAALTFWDTGSVPGALLAGGAACGASTALLQSIIE